jgi:hypothetical protein
MKLPSRTSQILRLVVVTGSLVGLPIVANADASHLDGREAEAIALAVRDFRSKQGSFVEGKPVYGELKHYTVEVERRGRTFEINFVPKEPRPLKPNEAGTGGSTDYGWGVTYSISVDGLKIEHVDYMR